MAGENLLITGVVMALMRANTSLAPSAAGAVLATATTIANVPGMLDAKNEGWEKVSNDIDTLLNHLDSAMAEGADWIADDKKAFESSMTNFKGKIGELKKSIDDVGDALDASTDIYMAAYVALFGLAAAFLTVLIGLAILRMYPPFAPGATAAMVKAGLLLTYLSTKLKILLGAALTGMAAFVGSTALGFMRISSEQKAIPTAQQFEQIRIDYKAPDTFKAKQV